MTKEGAAAAVAGPPEKMEWNPPEPQEETRHPQVAELEDEAPQIEWYTVP